LQYASLLNPVSLCDDEKTQPLFVNRFLLVSDDQPPNSSVIKQFGKGERAL